MTWGCVFQLVELGAYQLERYPGCHFTFIDPRIARDEDAIVRKVRILHSQRIRVDGRRWYLVLPSPLASTGPESEPGISSKRDPSPLDCLQCACLFFSHNSSAS